jgi:hypothetical protein
MVDESGETVAELTAPDKVRWVAQADPAEVAGVVVDPGHEHGIGTVAFVWQRFS